MLIHIAHNISIIKMRGAIWTFKNVHPAWRITTKLIYDAARVSVLGCTSGKSFSFRATYNYKRSKTHRRVSRATGLTSSDAAFASTWFYSSCGRSNTSRPPGTWSTAWSHETFVDRNLLAIHHYKWSTCCLDILSSGLFDHLARIFPSSSSPSWLCCFDIPSVNPRKPKKRILYLLVCPRRLLSESMPLNTA